MPDTTNNTLRNSQGVAAEDGLRTFDLAPTSTDNLVFNVDPDYRYTIKNTGLAANLAASTNFCKYGLAKGGATATTVDAAVATAAKDHGWLKAGESASVGPGVGQIKVNAGSAALLVEVARELRTRDSIG